MKHCSKTKLFDYKIQKIILQNKNKEVFWDSYQTWEHELRNNIVCYQDLFGNLVTILYDFTNYELTLCIQNSGGIDMNKISDVLDEVGDDCYQNIYLYEWEIVSTYFDVMFKCNLLTKAEALSNDFYISVDEEGYLHLEFPYLEKDRRSFFNYIGYAQQVLDEIILPELEKIGRPVLLEEYKRFINAEMEEIYRKGEHGYGE